MLEDSLVDSKTVIIISNTSIKNNVAMSISHVCLDHNILAKTIYHAISVILTEIKLNIIHIDN